MENKLNKKMLNYAIKQFEKALKEEDYSQVDDGVCQVLWNKFGFPNSDVSKISENGRLYTEDVVKIYGLELGNMWWLYGRTEKVRATARLEVLKLIKKNDK